MRNGLALAGLLAASVATAAAVSYTAQDQGYYVVTCDGEQVSQHQQEREALESATNRTLDGATCQVTHPYSVQVEAALPEAAPTEPVPEEPAPDPTEGLVSLNAYITERCDFSASMWCRVETANSFSGVAWDGAVEGFDNGRTVQSLHRSFSGWAFDGRSLYFHGGGHAAWLGNEVYKLDLGTLKWSRLSDPQPLTVDLHGCPKPEIGPYATHTYATPLVHDGKMHVWGDYPECRPEASHNSYGMHAAFDLAAGEWGPMELTPQSDKFGATVKMTYSARYGDEAAVVGVRDEGSVFRYDLPTGELVSRSDSSGWVNHGDGAQNGSTFWFHSKRDGIYRSTDFGALERITGQIKAFEKWTALEYYPPRDQILATTGGGRVYATSPAFEGWTIYDAEGGAGVRSKFTHLPGTPYMLAMNDGSTQLWVFRPSEPTDVQGELEARGFTCADTVPGWECPNLSAQLEGGGDVTLEKGLYKQGAVIDVPTTLDANGSIFQSAIVNQRGLFHGKADFTLRNATLRRVSVNDGNAAGVRQESGSLTLENVTIRRTQNGFLMTGSGDAIVRDSLIERVGGSSNAPGRAHGLYYAGSGTLTVEGTTFRAAKQQGHLLKSGAPRTVITDSVLDEREGNGSRVIDQYRGGELIIRRTDITAAPDDGNPDVIGFDYEGHKDARSSWPNPSITIDGGSVDCAGGRLIAGRNSLSDATRAVTATLTECN